MSAVPDTRAAVTWTALRLGACSWPVRLQVCCGGTWSALAFSGKDVVGVGAGASREQALSVLAGRMAAADELGTRGAE